MNIFLSISFKHLFWVLLSFEYPYVLVQKYFFNYAPKIFFLAPSELETGNSAAEIHTCTGL